MVARYGQLFLGDVTGQAQHFHAVQQWSGNAVDLVGGADKQHLGKVHAHIQVVIEKFSVLFRVQHFQQGRRGVALEGCADLVDLIQHDHRVGHFHVLECLHELARHRPDVGTAVTLDFRFVAHASETEAVELPSQSISHGASDAGFTHAGRANQQENGAADLALESAHGKELEDALFDVIQAIVMRVECLPRMAEFELVL